MPNVNTKISASSYQQCDGTNFTTAGVDNSMKVGNGNMGVYTGIGMTFDGIDLVIIFAVSTSASSPTEWPNVSFMDLK